MKRRPSENYRDIRWLKLYSLLLTLAVIIALIRGFSTEQHLSVETIRVRGIIVEDIDGNERILIGAPVPFASNRVRTDTNRVKRYWGKNFPPEYMNWYASYDHDNYGILILDSLGFDRIAIGSPAPDPNIGKRIGASTGMIINDQNGFERTGYGILDVNGENRVILGLDNENGSEGIAIALFENGTSGISMGSRHGSIFLGKADTADYFADEAPFIGLIVKDSSGAEIGLNSIQ